MLTFLTLLWLVQNVYKHFSTNKLESFLPEKWLWNEHKMMGQTIRLYNYLIFNFLRLYKFQLNVIVKITFFQRFYIYEGSFLKKNC